jgi:hypothetical protein
MLERYDQTLKSAGRRDKRRWSGDVIAALQRELGSLAATTFEIHAGNEYRAFGLEQGIRELGGTVIVPTAGLSLGQQLAFYGARNQ